MIGREIVREAAALGFECAQIDAGAAREALRVWMEHARDSPMAGNRDEMRRELEGVGAVLMLALPYRTYEGYPEGVGRIGGYYPASQRAYVAVGELQGRLEAGGVAARQARRLPLKPLARAAGLGDYGRNGIIVRKGPHIALQALLLKDAAKGIAPARNEPMPCADCGLCESACPSGALRGGEVDVPRCLRNYMGRDVEIPPELAALMGDRLLGCDDCLNACPGKEKQAVPEAWADLFAWENLLDEERFMERRAAIGEIIGTNYARGLRAAALRRARDGQ